MKKDRGFVPIGIREYAKLHAKANPDENPSELLARLRSCVSDALKGASCQCGAPIWVVGSVAVGYACFTFPWGFGCRGTERRLASWPITILLDAQTARGYECAAPEEKRKCRHY